MRQPNQFSSQEDRELFFAETQTARVQKDAKYVLSINEYGEVHTVSKNENYRLPVLAVVGPGYSDHVYVKDTVLLEVGLGRTRPYNKFNGRNGGPGVRKRERVASIDLPRLNVLFGDLEDVLIDDARKCLKQRKEVTFQDFRGNEYIKGITYSVSFQDADVAAAVLQSEVRNNKTPIKEDMTLAANWIAGKLRPYEQLAFAEDKKIEQVLSRRHNGIDMVLQYLDRRDMMPHFYHFLFQYMKGRSEIDILEKIFRSRRGVTFQEVMTWEELVTKEGVPQFSDRLYIWTVPRSTFPPHRHKAYWRCMISPNSSEGPYPQHLVFRITPKDVLDEFDAKYGSDFEEDDDLPF